MEEHGYTGPPHWKYAAWWCQKAWSVSGLTIRMVQKTLNKIEYTSFLIEEGTVKEEVKEMELQLEEDFFHDIEDKEEEQQDNMDEE
jgi:hypothetical protein